MCHNPFKNYQWNSLFNLNILRNYGEIFTYHDNDHLDNALHSSEILFSYWLASSEKLKEITAD